MWNLLAKYRKRKRLKELNQQMDELWSRDHRPDTCMIDDCVFCSRYYRLLQESLELAVEP
jgi:hypothetical protein